MKSTKTFQEVQDYFEERKDTKYRGRFYESDLKNCLGVEIIDVPYILEQHYHGFFLAEIKHGFIVVPYYIDEEDHAMEGEFHYSRIRKMTAEDAVKMKWMKEEMEKTQKVLGTAIKAQRLRTITTS